MDLIFEQEWESRLICLFQSMILKWPFLKGLFILFTAFGEPFFLVLVCGFLYFGYRKRWGIYTILCILSTETANNLIKNIVRRPRPYMTHEEIQCLKPLDSRHDLYDEVRQGFSFPSGHSSGAASFCASLFACSGSRNVLIIGVPIVLLVAASRFSLGVHYPTDVCAGILLGIVNTAMIDRLYRKIDRKHLYLLLTLLCLPGIFFCTSEDYYSVIGIFMGFMAGNLYEEKHIGFEDCKDIRKAIVRTLIGGLLFLMVTGTLKYAASGLFVPESKPALLYKSFRYGVSAFVMTGLYPYLFRYGILK